MVSLFLLVMLQHIALAIGEETELHTRLLDDLGEEVDVTQSRLKVTAHKVRQA
jgi:SYP5 family syntaxin